VCLSSLLLLRWHLCSQLSLRCWVLCACRSSSLAPRASSPSEWHYGGVCHVIWKAFVAGSLRCTSLVSLHIPLCCPSECHFLCCSRSVFYLHLGAGHCYVHVRRECSCGYSRRG
jgi:hypothetical protein